MMELVTLSVEDAEVLVRKALWTHWAELEDYFEMTLDEVHINLYRSYALSVFNDKGTCLHFPDDDYDIPDVSRGLIDSVSHIRIDDIIGTSFRFCLHSPSFHDLAELLTER